MYPWQYDTNIYLPGGAISVAHQFLRCVLHQLAPNGIFMQMFQTHVDGELYFSPILISQSFSCILRSMPLFGHLIVHVFIIYICISDCVRLPFFRSVAQALQDFNELSPVAPLQMLLEVQLLLLLEMYVFA